METKKNRHADLTRKTGLFFNIGLILSIALVLAAFEWKTYNNGNFIPQGQVNDNFEDFVDVPRTVQPPPPPPKLIQIIEVPEDEEIEKELEPFKIDTEITEKMIIPELEIEEPKEEFNDGDTFIFVEHQPDFPGGMAAFYKFIQKKMKYPSQARKMGIEGKVFVQFVVDKDGSLTDINVIRGIGAGCDEEAIRVLKMAPKWNAGKQRGVPVKVRMTLPITFKLN